MNNILIPFAMVNNKVKKVDEMYKQDEIYCLECGERLILRNGDINIKHLAHQGNSDCAYKNEREYKKRGGGETYEHKYAKEFIRDNLKFFRQYGSQIIIKDGEFKLGGYNDLKIESIEVEYAGLKKEFDLDSMYIPDILIRTNKNIIALEIYKTNKKDLSKIVDNLKGKNIYVYEIDIRNISVLNFKDIFRNMKLIFSDLKVEFDSVIKPIHQNIVKCNNLKEKLDYKENELFNVRNKLEEVESNFEIFKINSQHNSKPNYQREREIKRQVKNEYEVKDKENVKCRSKCVKDWYSNKLNYLIDADLKKCELGTDEYAVLSRFKMFFNGKVGAYVNLGGDARLKEIANITKIYPSSIKYLGMNNDTFKEMVGMEHREVIDKGEEILRELVSEDILEIVCNIEG